MLLSASPVALLLAAIANGVKESFLLFFSSVGNSGDNDVFLTAFVSEVVVVAVALDCDFFSAAAAASASAFFLVVDACSCC